MIIGITGFRNVNIRQSKAQFYTTIGGVKKGYNGLGEKGYFFSIGCF